MLLIGPIVRTPKESEMSLSTQVKESLDQASACLREALAFAARTEHPAVVSMVSDLISRTESVESVQDFISVLDQKTDLQNK